ncbi:BQ5605_C007g04858 [Microbotryum silenes-dioicae]|uniref:BQ5605_C007g04858 protein n=1 Tax=Microbotryum silenes-dioicae TaxID=796604 RepID=A0A2X0P3Q9_9BASI|nr:BQ5605_C007g04858 [Microbotryum silenes-dioicae]
MSSASEPDSHNVEEVVAEADAGAAATAATGVDDSASELSRSSGRQQTPEEQDGGML